MSRFWVGFDVVGKAFHWVCLLDDEGDRLLSRRVEATEADIEAALSEIERLCGRGERMVGLDLTGGPATLLEAILLGRGERVFRVSGIAVNRAREAYVGGERKSDFGDARVIADRLRFRWRFLPEIRPAHERLADEMRVLVSHRRDLAQDNARRIVRLRALLSGAFPGLEAALDLSKQGPLLAVSRVATPSAGSAKPIFPAGSRRKGYARPTSSPGASSRRPKPSGASCPPRRPRLLWPPTSLARYCGTRSAWPPSTSVLRSWWPRTPREPSS